MKLPFTAAVITLALFAGATAQAAPSAAANSAFETGIEAYRTGDLSAAIEAWTKSADGGHPMSAFLLGRLYEQGRGVEQSDAQSFKYYLMAADEGQAQAGVKVGKIYLTGNKNLSIDRDYSMALKYFEIGGLSSWPESQVLLADMYRRGLGVTADRTEGLRWLILAAKKKYAPSQVALARIYSEAFDLNEVALLVSLANQVGLAVSAARMRQRLQEVAVDRETVKALDHRHQDQQVAVDDHKQQHGHVAEKAGHGTDLRVG